MHQLSDVDGSTNRYAFPFNLGLLFCGYWLFWLFGVGFFLVRCKIYRRQMFVENVIVVMPE